MVPCLPPYAALRCASSLRWASRTSIPSPSNACSAAYILSHAGCWSSLYSFSRDVKPASFDSRSFRHAWSKSQLASNSLAMRSATSVLFNVFIRIILIWGGIGSPSRHVCSKPQDDPDVKRKYSHIWTIDCQCHSMLVACARDIESSRSNNRANLWGPTQAHTLVNPCTNHANVAPKVIHRLSTDPRVIHRQTKVIHNLGQPVQNLWITWDGGGGLTCVDNCCSHWRTK